MRRKQDTSFRVEAATELMPFLLSKLGGMTRTSVKQLLSQRRVTVNAGIQTRHDTPLKPGDLVNILQGRGTWNFVTQNFVLSTKMMRLSSWRKRTDYSPCHTTLKAAR